MADPAGRSRKRKRKIPLKRIAAAGGMLVLVLLCLVLCRMIRPGTYRQDPNAAPIADDKKAEIKKLQNQLQSQADENSFRLQINAKPRVRGDQAELLLGNPAENKLCLSVDLVLNEDGKTVYESGTLVPGAQVLTAALTRSLPPGEYPTTAVCRAIDPATGKAVGTPLRVDLTLEAGKTEKEADTPGSQADPTTIP